MARNVEIKAKASNWAHQLELAQQMADRGPEHLQQHDIFYQVPQGRLKLRIFPDNYGELISYHRPDQAGPKTSQYQISPTHEPEQLHQTLSAVLPVIGSVIKSRQVWFKGRTRLHFDQVVDLGQFIELEVVLADGETIEEGQAEANAIAKQLQIQEHDLIQGAYIDLGI